MSRIFQGVIIQMREASARVVGVVDEDGLVVACTELAMMGQCIGRAPRQESIDGVFRAEGRTYRGLEGAMPEYTVFADGEDELARTLCIMASVAVFEVKQHFEENNDRSAFIKSILSDNVLPGDVYVRSKDLRFATETPRACILVRQTGVPDTAAVAALRDVFQDKQNEFVISINAADIAVVAELPANEEPNLAGLAELIERHLSAQLGDGFVIGVGTPARSLRELADRYKEAQVAIEVGKVFDTERTVIYYENLGIGRLIYQLPTTLCEMFLSEVFKKNPIEALDTETLYTINKFFENNLNVSETSRRLFVHRNTLVYRLEKIRKLTGLDLRELDHAIVFKVALMVKKYLNSQNARYES